MRTVPQTAAPTGRKKAIGYRSSVIGDAAKPPAALGHESQNTPSPKGAEETPSAWRRARIGDTLRLINGTAFKPTDWTADGLPIVRIQNLNNPDAAYNRFNGRLPEKFRLQGGELLFAWSGTPGTSFGAHIWRGGDAWLNQHIFNVLFDEGEWDKRFLRLAINQNLADYIRAAHGGAGLAHITKGRFEESELLQPPLPEQCRIVAEIEKQFTRLEAGVAALGRVQANLRRYRAAVLKAACEGKLVPTEADLARAPVGRVPPRGVRSHAQNAASGDAAYNDAPYETGEQLLHRILAERRKNWSGCGKYKEPAATNTTNLPSLPEGWTWVSVEHLLREPLCNGVSIKGSDNPPGVRALRLSAMSNSGFDYSDARYLPLSESDVDDLWIQEGDFFMSRGNGSLHLVGRGTSAQTPPQPTIFPDTMIRLRLADAVRISGWVRTLWPSRIIRSQIEMRVKTTAGIYKIAQPQVEGMAIPLPPLSEQTRIVAEVDRRLSVVEGLEAVVSANLQRATRLRQSILQKAFRGELVTADDTDDADKGSNPSAQSA